MAKASDEEWQKVMDFVNELDEMVQDVNFSNKEIGEFVRMRKPNLFRVCYGYQLLVNNCCKKDSDVLEFNDELSALKRTTQTA